MLYSVKMRSAQGGSHETGGRHISGAERVVEAAVIKQVATEMIDRALGHSRGCADFINLKIEAIAAAAFITVPLLAIQTLSATELTEGRQLAVQALIKAGVTAAGAESGLAQLMARKDGMRGAMLLSATSGERLDELGERGVRVSCMDIADDRQLDWHLAELGLTNIHVREAVVLAAKVVSAPGVIAELCWSDDLDYTTGYVATSTAYIRLPHLKQADDPAGGRAFFVTPGTIISDLIFYLEEQPVLVELRGEQPCRQ
jgi:6-carboxyhexanoate--CoA ligase